MVFNAHMETQKTTQLNTDWLYRFADDRIAEFTLLRADDPFWIPLPSLKDWAMGMSIPGSVDWFRKVVTFNPQTDSWQEGCILCIDSVPDVVDVYFNDRHICTLNRNETLQQEIAPLIVNGDNVLTLKVTSKSDTSGGIFGDVGLRLFSQYRHRH